MSFSMVAPHSKRPIVEDKIFGANRAAQEAVKKHGFENVINSTIGAFLDDNGKLILMESVMGNLRNLSDAEIAAYAPISGTAEFIEAVKKAAFRDKTPAGYMEAVATPGGSGAIRNTIWNYSELGDTVITSDWYWSGYKTLVEENGRKLDTFKLFDEKKNFNINSFKEKVEEVLKVQERILIILNTPAHNPTGFSLSFSEWQDVIKLIREFAKDETKKITLLCDVAYIDFAGKDSRDFMELLGGLPKNVLSIVAFSLSKGEVSDIVETQFGYHLIKVTERKDARTVPLEEARDQIAKYVKNTKEQQAVNGYIGTLREKAEVEYVEAGT